MSRTYFTKSALVYRLTNDSGSTTKEAYVSTGVYVPGSLMNANPADSMLSEGNPSKSSVFFCDPASDIKDSDKLVIDSISYIVKGVAKTDISIMSCNYKKCLLEKQNA